MSGFQQVLDVRFAGRLRRCKSAPPRPSAAVAARSDAPVAPSAAPPARVLRLPSIGASSPCWPGSHPRPASRAPAQPLSAAQAVGGLAHDPGAGSSGPSTVPLGTVRAVAIVSRSVPAAAPLRLVSAVPRRPRMTATRSVSDPCNPSAMPAARSPLGPSASHRRSAHSIQPC